VTTSIVPLTVAPAAAASTRRLLDAKAVGERLGCSWRTVFRLADRGAMPPGLKLGALRRWDAEQLENWIAGGCKPMRQPGRIQ
jgi:predicted DNA-binding transcriptional regulator AlpA